MSNSVVVATPVHYGLARDELKAQLGFTVKRAGKKGEVVRGTLGVALSGNLAERLALAQHLAVEHWVTGNFAAIAAEIVRVFPSITDAIDRRNLAVEMLMTENPEQAGKLRPIKIEGAGKMDVIGMLALASKAKGADKGEKARLLAAGAAIHEFESQVKVRALELATRDAAIAAELDRIDAETEAEVL